MIHFALERYQELAVSSREGSLGLSKWLNDPMQPCSRHSAVVVNTVSATERDHVTSSISSLLKSQVFEVEDVLPFSFIPFNGVNGSGLSI